MPDYLMIGEVLKPQGIRGECKIRSWASDISLFSRWKELFLMEGSEYTPVSFRFGSIQDPFVYGILGECATMKDAEGNGPERRFPRSGSLRPADCRLFSPAGRGGCF